MDIQAQAKTPLSLEQSRPGVQVPGRYATQPVTWSEGIEAKAYRRCTKTGFSWRQMLLLLGGVVAIFSIGQRLEKPENIAFGLVVGTPLLPIRLIRAAVLPTPSLRYSKEVSPLPTKP